jgi:uncharacterized membrane protein
MRVGEASRSESELNMLTLAVLALIVVMMCLLWNRIGKLEKALISLNRRVLTLEHGAPEAGAPAVAPFAGPARTAPPASPPDSTGRASEPAVAQQRPSQRAATSVLPAAARAESLETMIGSRWLLYVGVIAIVIGVAYFQKLAIDSGWIDESARVIQTAIAGILMVWGGRRLSTKGMGLYGQMVAGCGLAVLYVAIFASFNFYQLVGRPIAIALMFSTTALSVWLADRERSQGLAILAVGGGFATPFLLPAPTDAQFALFSYVAVLIAGTMALAHRRAWPALNIVSYGLTLLTVLVWVARFYTSAQYLTTELFFTLFCAMFLYVLRQGRRADDWLAHAARAILWTGPILYYLGSLLVLHEHTVAFFVYLQLLSFTAAIGGLRRRAHPLQGADVRLLGWFAAMLPLLIWLGAHASRDWLVGGLAELFGIYTTHLVAAIASWNRQHEDMNRFEITLLHANGLGAFAGGYLLIAASNPGWSAASAGMFSLWHGGLALGIRRRHLEHAIHLGVVAASLLIVAIGLQFDGAWVTMGWAAEGALLAAVSLPYSKPWLHIGGIALFAVAVARLVGLLLEAAPLSQMTLLNERVACGLLVAALAGWLAWVHQRQAPSARRHLEVASAVLVSLVLLLAVITSEIAAFWRIRDVGWTRSWSNIALARGMAISIAWAAYAVALAVIGLRRRYAPLRYLAFAIFAMTIGKVFLVDMASLDRIFRVLSIVGLGVTLLLTSYLYHRCRSWLSPAAPETTPALPPINP